MTKTKVNITVVLLGSLTSAIAAATAYIFYLVASDYSLSFTAAKIYCVLWFAAAVIAVFMSLLTNSIIAITASAIGFVAFAAICMIDTEFCTRCQHLTRTVEIAAPMLFITAWLFTTAAAFKSKSLALRRSGWACLLIALTLTMTYPAYNYSRFKLSRLRSEHILTAATNTLMIAQQLTVYRQANGEYPKTLEPAGIDPQLLQLPYRSQQIKYFGSSSMFILTFQDPMPTTNVVYAWDTSKGGWYPIDPQESLFEPPHNLFLGALNK